MWIWGTLTILEILLLLVLDHDLFLYFQVGQLLLGLQFMLSYIGYFFEFSVFSKN